MKRFLLLFSALAASALAAEPKFQAITLDPAIQIGYGLAIADVDGDRQPDVLLADKKQFVWYQNPGPKSAHDPAAWKKHLLAENLTQADNVCIAAQDLDGDGKCEIAVGAEWNPSDTVNSGAVFYLVPPADRTQKWEAIKLHAEPTVHRMRWIPLAGGAAKWGLVVAPLHGRGNKNGEGEPVKILLYTPPAGDPKGEWKTEPVSASLHATHNFEAIGNPGHAADMVIGGKEGAVRVRFDEGKEHWNEYGFIDNKTSPLGIGEVRLGAGPGNAKFLACVEPMHGNTLTVYNLQDAAGARTQLTDKLADGHALACGDLLGAGRDQIVLGWRGNAKDPKNIGVALWIADDDHASKWHSVPIDPDGMACEDLKLADLDGDGKLDIIAAGRATKNVKIYFNESH